MQYSVDDEGRLWEHDGVKDRRAGDVRWQIGARPFGVAKHDNLTDAYMHKAQAQAKLILSLLQQLADKRKP